MTEDRLDPSDVLSELVGEAADVKVAAVGEATEFSRLGRPFAVRVANGAIEFRLGDEIGEAARRTPDTGRSNRGTEWVRFAPAQWDEHALDRLEAWFRVAWRMSSSR